LKRSVRKCDRCRSLCRRTGPPSRSCGASLLARQPSRLARHQTRVFLPLKVKRLSNPPSGYACIREGRNP
jgi:hypothetical protein